MSPAPLQHSDIFEETGRSDIYVRPDHPMKIEEGPRSGGVVIPEDERRLLLDYVSWRKNPPVQGSGRSGLVTRREVLEAGTAQIVRYQLKGVLYSDHETGLVRPPSTERYWHRLVNKREDRGRTADETRTRIIGLIPRQITHMGVNDDGSFRPVPDPPKPEGGLGPKRAEREFQIAAQLHRAGIPACRPVDWGRYPELLWEGAPMEYVILSLPPEIDPHRMSDYFQPTIIQEKPHWSRAMQNIISQQFDVFDPANLGPCALKVTAQMARANGKVLREAHERGRVVRFAGHTGNFSYARRTKTALMHDFDSSVKLDDLHPQARALTIIRDIESALFGFLHSLAHSNLFYLSKNEEAFRRVNPLGQILTGYFEGDIGLEALKPYLDRVSNAALDAIKSRGELPSTLDQAKWLGHMAEVLIRFFMLLVFKLYPLSRWASTDPLPHNDEKRLLADIQAFGIQGERMNLEHILQHGKTMPDWAREQLAEDLIPPDSPLDYRLQIRRELGLG